MSRAICRSGRQLAGKADSSRHDDDIVPAIPNRVIGAGERRIDARIRHRIVSAELLGNVFARGAFADRIDRDSVAAAVDDEG